MYTRNTKNFDRLNFILDYFDIDWDAILQANKDDVNLSMQIFMKKWAFGQIYTLEETNT